MSWTPLVERFAALPLILAGPILRRTEPRAVTVWLALKTPQTVALRIYARDGTGNLNPRMEGMRRTVRLGDHLHIVAITARSANSDEQLAWGGLYYYDLFFQPDRPSGDHEPVPAAHLGTPGILTNDPAQTDPLRQLVYPGHPLPSFVLPPEDLNQLRIIHGSCRKPHGIGKEMLSALDSILEDSAQNPLQRPQQLFLTGDQIYADDVAEPLLHALTDTGNFLFGGNKEEVLPSLNVPARMLPPGERTDAVRNRAMFSTDTPENHLLALAEFSAMYLFAWSDVLWPDDLPLAESSRTYPDAGHQSMQQKEKQEYTRKMEQLQEFRSTLPQVRRALANIATYMICDDHDMTDDWFLDGAWCQRVLANELGRRIVRNGLLAYALFQAWGNTPDQFEEPHGTVLLEAIDTWRGDEFDRQTALIAQSIGLPDAFNGSGELQRSEQALRWHYTFSGPRYQVIVMDTRTQRTYQEPHAFPGLLSPGALATQVSAYVREDMDVTLIVSATPVFGMGLVEAIQHWSRILNKENYDCDPEAWALERSTFQNFLKAISAMKRVVILSGDVHYAFGSSLTYWDNHSGETAKIINYTSSPLRNEGTSSQVDVLAMGYPELFRFLRRGKAPWRDLFAWDILNGTSRELYQMLQTIRWHFYKLWGSVPSLVDMWKSPHSVMLPAHGWQRGAFAGIPPDRSYRLYYLPDMRYLRAKAHKPRLSPERAQGVETGDPLAKQTIAFQQPVPLVRPHALTYGVEHDIQLLEHSVVTDVERVEYELERDETIVAETVQHPDETLSQWKDGMLIVGYANIGEISFQWTPEEKNAIQRLWWCHPDHPEQPALATEYRDTLELPQFDAAPRLP
jgi:hypothetical protein